MRLLFGLTGLVMFGCDLSPREAVAPNTSATPGESVSVVASTPVTPSSATLLVPSVAARFPALDDSCAVDADCVLFEEELTDAPPRTYTCCSGCTQRVANKNWLARFRSLCRGFTPPSCPPLGCAMPILRPACQAGRCVTLQ